jgi:hypothetical protein
MMKSSAFVSFSATIKPPLNSNNLLLLLFTAEAHACSDFTALFCMISTSFRLLQVRFESLSLSILSRRFHHVFVQTFILLFTEQILNSARLHVKILLETGVFRYVHSSLFHKKHHILHTLNVKLVL